MMIYIASPYTSPDPSVMEDRYQKVRCFTAEGLRVGLVLFSPIVHCHPLAAAHNLPKDFAFWQTYSLAMIDLAKMVLVLQLPGHETSRGVQDEIQYCKEKNIPLWYWSVPTGAQYDFQDLCQRFWTIYMSTQERKDALDK